MMRRRKLIIDRVLRCLAISMGLALLLSLPLHLYCQVVGATVTGMIFDVSARLSLTSKSPSGMWPPKLPRSSPPMPMVFTRRRTCCPEATTSRSRLQDLKLRSGEA